MALTNELETLSKTIKTRRERVLSRRDWFRLARRVLILALAFWLVLTQVFFVMQASGNDMFPAVKDGDLIIAYRLQQDYVKSDVVVYTVNGETRVGRIAARETDVVTLDDSGTLLVNGTTQTGEILYPTYAGSGLSYPYTVPNGCVFILGDYRTQAKDSREFGPVPMEDVIGKVITILRRRGL